MHLWGCCCGLRRDRQREQQGKDLDTLIDLYLFQSLSRPPTVQQPHPVKSPTPRPDATWPIHSAATSADVDTADDKITLTADDKLTIAADDKITLTADDKITLAAGNVSTQLVHTEFPLTATGHAGIPKALNHSASPDLMYTRDSKNSLMTEKSKIDQNEEPAEQSLMVPETSATRSSPGRNTHGMNDRLFLT
ncbi:MAG: hypothetical protein SGCHY_002163, partial [Lobulomycetales sp.]